jgi:ribonuclease D
MLPPVTDVRVRFIDSSAGLKQIAETLEGASSFYLDTEFESTREGTELCLLQLSGGDDVYVVDALRVSDLTPLAPALTSNSCEWVLHAGLQDVELLLDRLGPIGLPRIFDVQIAWSLLGPEHAVSLAYVMYRVLGIRAKKSYQTDNWKRRPLPSSQLAYAANDIVHLPALRAELGRRATELERQQYVYDASREAVLPAIEAPAPISLASFRNAWQLDVPSQAALRFIVDWYNRLSPEDRVRAPEPKTLLAIANRLPETRSDLTHIKGVPRRWAAEYGEHFVSQLQLVQSQAAASDFVPIEPPAYASFDEMRVDGWLAFARAEICIALGVAPELLYPARLVRQMRQAILRAGTVDAGESALSGWRSGLSGESYRRFCRRHPLNPP